MRSGKLVNSEYYSSGLNLLSFDLNAKYDFTYLYDINEKWLHKESKVCDVYATGGFGFTYRNQNRVHGCATFNFGLGCTGIIYQNWGFNVEAMTKWGLVSPIIRTPANYIQYTVGAIYRFKMDLRIGRRNGIGRRYLIKK